MSFPTNRPSSGVYAGLFCMTLATLLQELLLTRIFSVTMWYHFAFVAISIAMFGMTMGSIWVYLRPEKFTPEQVNARMATMSLLFGVTVVLSFLTHLIIPFQIQPSILGAYTVLFTYAIISVPFVFSGVCVSLALTRFPGFTGRLYAVDLAGAAAGCIAMLVILRVTDAPTAVVLVAFLASTGALFFIMGQSRVRLRNLAIMACLLFGGFAVINMPLVRWQTPLIRTIWAKEGMEPIPLYEKWSSYARIRVDTRPILPIKPFGWGMSRTYRNTTGTAEVEELSLRIDASAGTVLTKFDGSPSSTEHLKYDITNFAHYIRPNSDVLVVGTGGGRDILAALAFDQKSVIGVELNRDILVTVNKVFGNFTGHLDEYPGVTFVNDEARSYIAGSSRKYDMIMVSLIDTWAATAAGAYVLTENSLYTVEAWKTFIAHLTDRGVLTFSRWYFKDRPGEMYRLTSLAVESLRQMGIGDPLKHLVILRQMITMEGREIPDGIGTMLLSKKPFTAADLQKVREVAARMQFEVVLTPEQAGDPVFSSIVTGKGLREIAAKSPYRFDPPTDDSPFFFNMLRFGDMLNYKAWSQGFVSFNMKAVFVLFALLVTVFMLTAICIIVPLLPTMRTLPKDLTLRLSVFFAAIGFGFMFIEISQMQRLIIFLGHPTYGLSVVLFSLLLSSGIGSWLTEARPSVFGRPSILLVLIGSLLVFGLVTPWLVREFDSSQTPMRVLLSIGTLVPIGLFMGMAFPIGMRRSQELCARLGPWLWGVNGAFSVCASVLSVVVALAAGITASYWTGVACYAIAFLAMAATSRFSPVNENC